MTRPTHDPLPLNDRETEARRRQIDPAGSPREDPRATARRAQKQAGQDLRDPQGEDDNAK